MNGVGVRCELEDEHVSIVGPKGEKKAPTLPLSATRCRSERQEKRSMEVVRLYLKLENVWME